MAMLYANSTTMHLSVLSKTMDPVFTGMKGMSDFGESIVPTITFAEYLRRSEGLEEGYGNSVAGRKRHASGDAPVSGHDAKGEIEVLFVPGGGGTRQNMTEEIDFVRRLYPKVCAYLFISGRTTINFNA